MESKEIELTAVKILTEVAEYIDFWGPKLPLKLKQDFQSLLELEQAQSSKTSVNNLSGLYRLMCTLVHSSLCFREKLLNVTNLNSPEAFYKDNEDVMKEIFDETLHHYEYELSYRQMMAGITLFKHNKKN